MAETTSKVPVKSEKARAPFQRYGGRLKACAEKSIAIR